MKQLLKQVDAEGVFDPATIDVLVAAFDAAWTTVLEGGRLFSDERYREAVRETLAMQIIDTAKAGERDPQRLTQDALLLLSKTPLKQS